MNQKTLLRPEGRRAPEASRLRVVAVIQARMGSTRLPGKVMRRIAGQPMIGWMVERLKACTEVDEVVISTTTQRRDHGVAHFANQIGVRCYRGSEADLIDRLYFTARTFEADAIVRITADCPFVDPDVVDRLVNTYRSLQGHVDYVTNNSPRTYPHGLDAEVLPMTTLQKLWEEIKDPYYREWIPYYIQKRRGQFCIVNVELSVDGPPLSHHRWTVDYPEDMAFARRVFRTLVPSRRIFRMKDVLELLDQRPKLISINAHLGEGAEKHEVKI